MFSSYVADPSTPYVATTQRWSPFFGGTLASAHVHPTPTTCLWSSPPLPDGGDRRTPRVYAVRQVARSARDVLLGLGAQRVHQDSRGRTRASRSVRDAGTAITHPRDCAAPPRDAAPHASGGVHRPAPRGARAPSAAWRGG